MFTSSVFFLNYIVNIIYIMRQKNITNTLSISIHAATFALWSKHFEL